MELLDDWRPGRKGYKADAQQRATIAGEKHTARRLKRRFAEVEERHTHTNVLTAATRPPHGDGRAGLTASFLLPALFFLFFFLRLFHPKIAIGLLQRSARRPSEQYDVCIYKRGVSYQIFIRSARMTTMAATTAAGRSREEECETPCTYTECILSVFLSGIPSVYVTGGYTEQRWSTAAHGGSWVSSHDPSCTRFVSLNI